MISLLPPPPDLLDGAALFLDFDGTLVDLADTPDDIRVEPALHDLLERLRDRLDGRLAIVSGRSLDDLDRHILCRDLIFSGSHGAELRLADGSSSAISVSDDLVQIRAEAHRFARARPGMLVEEKPAGIALHFRMAPGEGDAAESFLSGLAERHDLAMQKGKMVVELRPRGADKGNALFAIMSEPSFAGTRPVFVGDDLTDEEGFEAAKTLGGAGILVGPERQTSALFRLGSVAEVADWLGRAA